MLDSLTQSRSFCHSIQINSIMLSSLAEQVEDLLKEKDPDDVATFIRARTEVD